MAKNTLRVRVKAKAQNAILARLADDLGGVAAAAKELGVSPPTFSNWLNLHATPWGKSGNGHVHLRTDRARQLVLKLEQLTGESICNIFPISKKQLEPLAKERTYERDVKLTALEHYAQEQAALIESNINNGQRNLELDEAREALEKALKTLSARERDIVKLRFGLTEDGHSYKLDEVARIFKITRERVRQIEVKALGKLRWTGRVKDLVGHVD